MSAWEIAAWWYASVAVAFELSVAELSLLIDRWRELILSAASWMIHLGAQEPAEPPTGGSLAHIWWLSRSDLEHAGYNPDALPDELRQAADDYVVQHRDAGVLVPSSMQPGSPERPS